MKNISIEKGGEIPETGETTYNVECGCKNFVFIGKEALLKFLDEYISDPDGYELRYEEKHGGGINQVPAAWWEETLGRWRDGKENRVEYWGLSAREQVEEQLRKDFQKDVESRGGRYLIIHSFDEAEALVREHKSKIKKENPPHGR